MLKFIFEPGLHIALTLSLERLNLLYLRDVVL